MRSNSNHRLLTSNSRPEADAETPRPATGKELIMIIAALLLILEEAYEGAKSVTTDDDIHIKVGLFTIRHNGECYIVTLGQNVEKFNYAIDVLSYIRGETE
jgi:hypothetical protein